MPAIKNIIFDLGGVLLNIDTDKTNEAFKTLGIKEFKNNYSLHKADELFDNLEKGKVTELDFYKSIREMSNLPLKDVHIRKAWNALLLNFREDSLQYLKRLQKGYRLYLLSNTNAIHHLAFQQIFKNQTGERRFDDYFVKTYYSHQVGLRKPEKEIFEMVLADAGIIARETLFIDDLLKNIEVAASLGIHTHQLLPNEKIETLKCY
jgi:glucose-1-phosphatase